MFHVQVRAWTLLWFAIERQRFDAIEVLVSLGSNPDGQVVEGVGTSVLHALGVEDLRYLRALLDGGLPLDRLDANGETLLFLAAGPAGRTINHVKLLVERGANVNLARPNGETPIFSAIFTMHADRVRYLLEREHGTGCATPSDAVGWRNQSEYSSLPQVLRAKRRVPPQALRPRR